MPIYYIDLDASALTLPADGAEVGISGQLRRDDSGAPGNWDRGAGARAIFVSGAPLEMTVPKLTAGSIDQPNPGEALTVSGSNASATATYQWQQSNDGATWSDISGSTGAALDTSALPGNMYVRRAVSDGAQGPVYSASVGFGARPMTAAVIDFGTYVDGNPVTRSGGDLIWMDGATQDMAIVGGAVQPTAANSTARIQYDGALLGPDQFASIAIEGFAQSTGRRVFLFVRVADDNNRYWLQAENLATDTLTLWKRVAGTYTELTSVPWPLDSAKDLPGGVLRLEAFGTTIRALWKGAEVLRVIDSALSSGQPGFGLRNSNTNHDELRMSEFRAGEL